MHCSGKSFCQVPELALNTTYSGLHMQNVSVLMYEVGFSLMLYHCVMYLSMLTEVTAYTSDIILHFC